MAISTRCLVAALLLLPSAEVRGLGVFRTTALAVTHVGLLAGWVAFAIHVQPHNHGL